MTETPEAKKIPWYYRKKFVIILLVVIAPLSPLVFPLLWFSPQFSRGWKIAVTVITVVACAVLAVLTVQMMQSLEGQFRQLKSMGILS